MQNITTLSLSLPPTLPHFQLTMVALVLRRTAVTSLTESIRSFVAIQ